MSSFGNADNKGRSSGKYNGRIGRQMKPPKGHSWVWFTRELMLSDAWLMQSRICRLFIDALLLDLMANAGQENGRLKATYDQLSFLGLNRSSISKAISEAEFLGLMRCMKKGGRYGGTNKPSEYRLTFYPMVIGEGNIQVATNEWKRVSRDDVKLWHENEKHKRLVAKHNREKRAREKQFSGADIHTSPGRISGLVQANLKVVK